VTTWTCLNSALLTLQAQAPAPAVPEPSLRPGLDEADITPGVVGFLFTALMVVMAIIVLRLMVRSVRRVQLRSPDAEEMLVERNQPRLTAEQRTAGEGIEASGEDRLQRLRKKYPGYLDEPTPEPQEPDTGR